MKSRIGRCAWMCLMQSLVAYVPVMATLWQCSKWTIKVAKTAQRYHQRYWKRTCRLWRSMQGIQQSIACTAQHWTALNCTAQHSTAQHSMAKLKHAMWPCCSSRCIDCRHYITFQVLSTKVAVRTVCAISCPLGSSRLAIAMASSKTPPAKQTLVHSFMFWINEPFMQSFSQSFVSLFTLSCKTRAGAINLLQPVRTLTFFSYFRLNADSWQVIAYKNCHAIHLGYCPSLRCSLACPST